ncbi:protein of unknown function [Microbacterium sp. Nx66]|nr:protein of unknown function [Microbacterium sp. Nx66]
MAVAQLRIAACDPRHVNVRPLHQNPPRGFIFPRPPLDSLGEPIICERFVVVPSSPLCLTTNAEFVLLPIALVDVACDYVRVSPAKLLNNASDGGPGHVSDIVLDDGVGVAGKLALGDACCCAELVKVGDLKGR